MGAPVPQIPSLSFPCAASLCPHLPVGSASPGPERRWLGEDLRGPVPPSASLRQVCLWAEEGGWRLVVTFLRRLLAFVGQNTHPRAAASDKMRPDITRRGTYFAQKHALLVVETSFAFPETNDGAVFSFGGP